MSVSAERRFRRPSYFIPFVVVLLVLAVVAAALIVQTVRADNAQREAEARNSQVIHSITREEQVVLLSLGIQGIAERNQDTQLFGIEGLRIPFSERATFVQYEFTAKLGIEGGDVGIERVDEERYRITIPEFQFIGHDNENFTVAATDGGVLRWITPKIDPVEMVNDVLSPDAQGEYVESNREILREQAENFYGGILRAVDENITAEYVFED
ncbi:MAG: hypothetical protein Q4G34_02925 [Micrococcus sp.]|nr:hypothetical protein [Micrococcus sp.]